jgi:hypothetical protein
MRQKPEARSEQEAHHEKLRENLTLQHASERAARKPELSGWREQELA